MKLQFALAVIVAVVSENLSDAHDVGEHHNAAEQNQQPNKPQQPREHHPETNMHPKKFYTDTRGKPDKREHTKTRTSATNTRADPDTNEIRGKRDDTKTRTGTKTAEHQSKARAHAARVDDGPSMIVGGNQADVAEYPYYVDMDGCGASLIAPGVVLSAAHCDPDDFTHVGQTVIVGGYDRQQVTNGAVRATVTETLMHPSWDPWGGMSYDFMLLKLDSPVTTSGSVKLSLNSESTVPSSGQPLTVVGNGDTEEDGIQSDVLLEAEVPAISTVTCNGPYDGEIVDEVMFCAGGNGKDTCQGDSGGPIVVRNGNIHTQVGVTSWGHGCNRPGIPAVYARVSSVMNWIAHVTCTCWGVNDETICSFLDSNDDFTCEDVESAGGGIGGGSGPGGCEVISGWTDDYGDGCHWYEANDVEGCPETGNLIGIGDKTAWDACCHCEGGGPSGGSGGSDTAGCQLISGWVDSADDSCGWYEANDGTGCPNFGYIAGTGGHTAWQACCHCEGGVSDVNPGCQLVADWTDAAGDSCGWYEENDSEGCPLYGNTMGTDGVLAWSACCHCEGGGADFFGCQLISGWIDEYQTSCGWYETNETAGCPFEGDVVGTGGATANEACCFCAGTDGDGQGNDGVVNVISDPVTSGNNNSTTSSGNALVVSIATGLASLLLLLGSIAG
ncbi:unnamed protein product [Cylindrotheca closterium]|uniref:Peptidase S1 domain-containing protein n=1 Tax=Cylindrotheca closterium TaxID=2856 RepID=A0AAD2G5H2_9STRA|nr:unnamed protein product [Cylindrotheca closterium]